MTPVWHGDRIRRPRRIQRAGATGVAEFAEAEMLELSGTADTATGPGDTGDSRLHHPRASNCEGLRCTQIRSRQIGAHKPRECFTDQLAAVSVGIFDSEARLTLIFRTI